MTFWSIPIQANPSGGVVVNGDVTFSGGAGNLQINQGSQKAIIDWADFSIDAGELTQFNQPGSTAAVLNRVTGGNPSAIHGALKANGNVFVINPNGILVGANGTIDVHGLALSTLDVSNGEFLAGGDMVFKGGSGDITNMGRINAIGGDVFLIGRTVTNAAGGTITARNGTVGLAAGEEVLLKEDSGMGNERMFVRAKGSGVSGTGILNNGTIEGASVELKAHGNMFALAINNKGSIRATGVSNYGGSVHLKGIGGGVENSGSIAVSAPSSGSGGRILIEAAYAKVDGMLRAERGRIAINGTDAVDLNGSIDVTSSDRVGGKVEVEGAVINVGASSDIDASGGFGGGVVKIGGGFQGRDASISNATTLTVAEGSAIRANALETGDGGVVILWSDDTTIFEGSVSALGAGAHRSGGFAEISGKGNLGFDGIVDLSSDHGLSGTLLLDPTNVTISSDTASAAVVNNVALSNSLDAGNNVIITTNFGGSDPGNITVNNKVEWYADSAATTPGTLTLLAANDVIFNDSVRSAGTGGINIVAGWDGSTGIDTPLGGSVETVGSFNMAAVLDTMPGAAGEAANDAAGNGGGSIFIGNATTLATQVNVGSRYGDTLVAGHDLIMRGDNTTERFAQLGFTDNGVEFQISNANTNNNGVNNGLVNEWWGSDAANDGTGFTTHRNLLGKNYIDLLGGTRFLGGDFDGAGSGATGDITARLSGRADLRAGTTRAYVQIGHGGSGAEGFEERARANRTDIKTTRDGYTINTINGRQFFGTTWRTNTEAVIYDGVLNRVDGDITVHAVGDIFMLAAPGITTDPNLVANTNTGSGNYAMIGHGGAENVGSYHGDVSVIAEGTVGDGLEGDVVTASRLDGIGIDMVAGRAGLRFVKIGHGSYGEGNSGSIYDASRSGEIVVTAETGAVRMHGYTQTDGRSDQDASIHIGHGGTQTDVGRTDLTFTGLAGGLHGAINLTGIRADNSSTGNITVFAGGAYVDPNDDASQIGIGGMGGNQRWAYMQIGHGGANQRADTGEGYQGDIDVQAPQGDILFAAGANKNSNFDWGYGRTHSQIGHGGNNVDGAKGGSVTVLAGQGAGATDGDIIFKAGKHFESFAQIGNGGYGSSGNYDSLVNAADITVTAFGDISFDSGVSGDTDALGLSVAYANRWFNDRANGTSRSGYWQAQDRYIMIGHGGRDADGVMANKQDIYVTSGTGDVGDQLGGADGDVTTGGITFIAGTQDRDFAMIGHGGYSNGGNNPSGFNGDINIIANGGGVIFDGSLQGGQRFTRQTRSLDGSATTSIIMQAYDSNTQTFVQIGNGGYASRGNHSGNIDIFSNGGIDMLGSTTNPLSTVSFTAAVDNLDHLSNGVKAANSTANVYMSLSSLTDTAATTANENVVTGAANLGAAFLGRANVKPGSLRIVLSDGTIITDYPDRQSDERTSFIIDDQGNQIGEIVYDQAVVRFNAATIGNGAADVVSVDYESIGGRGEHNYAQIGHGGHESDGANNNLTDGGNTGNISILAASDIRMHAGDYHRSYTQLGHGGNDVKGHHSGNITIGLAPGTLGGKLEVLAGNGERHFDYQAYGQVGHGGYQADGNHFGDITITNGVGEDGRGIFLKAGSTSDSTVQIGHGGRDARSGTGSGADTFGLNGDIVISTGGDVAVIAGTGARNTDDWDDDFRIYAMIGHGGLQADASNSDSNYYGQNGGVAFARTAAGNTNAGIAGVGEGKWGHFGDISVITTGGDISFMGGSTVALADRLDSDGNVLPITNDPSLVSNGEGAGRYHYAIGGHGGLWTDGDHHGNIEFIAEDGSVNVVGGMYSSKNNQDKFNFAQVGHGGADSQGHTGRSDEFIRVHGLGGTGNVVVAAGSGRSSSAQIGSGGRNFDGTHLGDIEVWAGNDIVMQGGLTNARVVSRIGEYGDISGTNGGNGNDLSEFNAYWGTGGLNYLLMDQAAAAGGGQKTKVTGENIQAGTVEFRLQTNVYDGNAAADYVDDGAGNIVPAGGGAAVGTIDYVTGEITWNTAILGTDTANQPDIFVNYDHENFNINDSLRTYAQIGHGGYSSTSSTATHAEGAGVNTGHTGDIDVRAGVDAAGAFNGGGGQLIGKAGNDRRAYVQIGHGGTESRGAAGQFHSGTITVNADAGINFRGGQGLSDNHNVGFNYGGDGNIESVTQGRSNAGINDIDFNYAMIGHGGHDSDADNSRDNNLNDPLSTTEGHNGDIMILVDNGDVDFAAGGTRGYGHFAQVGHGGMNTHGNHHGNVDVLVNNGDINFAGGGDGF
ncbi:filamentous hemagglutinin N-terminal domain-containing protein [Verrucomicrobiales bacterium]|nr:filamentous hemagglutinin N-terminal domain-containing protein [Verrucomicrobiales bacterium]